MKLISKKSMALTLLTTVAVFMMSFIPAPGGDKFEIYLNKKLVVEQYVSQSSMTPKYINLTSANYNQSIDVYYYHCGKTGTSRSILLKDMKGKILKKIDFTDANSKTMSWKVKDIMDLLKGDRHSLKLYYTSRELPSGRQLATVTNGGNSFASLQ